MNDWITIMTFTYPHESYVIRGALESEGIQTFLKDELTIQIDNFLSNAIGGVRLQVPKDQVEDAVKLLKENGYLKEENPKKPLVEVLEPTNKEITECPFCKSDNFSMKKLPTLLSILSLIFLRIPLPIFNRNYVCHHCEKEWRYN